ncbi:MAG TPA: carbohydrate ABC transporter substrate-binding protein [Anaerolineae bacterium]|nr:carbohydrate ABC transporter substrate-binding protein [Anaerolineae bacterium]
MRILSTLLLASTILLIASCSTPSVQATPSPTTVGVETATRTPQILQSSPTPKGSLTIWFTPTFAPDPSTPAGFLLQERLTAFQQANPGISIIVRLKEERGPGGLLETLIAAHNVAPSALPDVIAIDPIALNSAALKGLLVPLNGLVAEPTPPEWYDHALLTTYDLGSFFGLPFASEVEVLAYRISRYEEAPASWSDILASPAAFVFPAGDPNAALTLFQYKALGGPLYDVNGMPTFDPVPLNDLLTFYRSAHVSGILSTSIFQYLSSTDTWNSLKSDQASSAIAPLSAFMATEDPKNIGAVPIPARTQPGICPTETWSWSIVTLDPVRQSLASELITWLTQPEFLGPWTYALGMLPPTASSLAMWPEGPAAALASSLVTVAQPKPSAEELATFGPILHQAVEAVILGGVSPTEAAQNALEELRRP